MDGAPPKISVVMTVFNDLRFLDDAIESIISQDFPDFELIVVDDGTGQQALFDAIARRDPRISVLANPINIGTAAAANRGIESARSDIIVRLDADDLAEPNRISRLFSMLSDDPELGLLGSWCTLIDETDSVIGVQPMPESDLEIRWTILFHNPFYHSTVAFRRHCFESAGHYRPGELVSQDHYLWFDMLPHCRARNVPEPLVRYRVNSRGLTTTDSRRGRSRTHRIREVLWSRIGLVYDLYDDKLAASISEFLRGRTIPAPRRTAAYHKLLLVLRAFLASVAPTARADDRFAAARLKRNLIRRILSEPPPLSYRALSICLLCCALGPYAACRAAVERMKLAAVPLVLGIRKRTQGGAGRG
ncbi:glycosyltransferase [Dongia deserti]|uniref:glycosyltransferase n=1 Tax=Dongia deserti TaxID=2268030 RepID=UPI000E64AE34|nr:glycosyltransferase [Dongia deserti]